MKAKPDRMVLMTALDNISDPTSDDESPHHQLETITLGLDLNELKDKDWPPVDFQLIDAAQVCSLNSSMYDPIRKLRFFPAPPPKRFTGSRRCRRD
jgi:hypothetical protein